MLCKWLEQHGHHCDTSRVADMPKAHDGVGQFIQKHRPAVVIYDVGMPYGSSWDLLEVIRLSAPLRSQPFVITTPNKRKLERAVGANTCAIEVAGLDTDLRRVLTAVEAAAADSRAGL
jgi:CheY-like chemotaxis protein